jgi:hypothetical protein
LHIIRVITDDTILKPFAREFYDHILFFILDGLNQQNWSIKNACMLLFSRLIKNHFMLDKRGDRDAPTFVEYFTNKNEFKKKFLSIFRNELDTDSTCHSILIILTDFICKFKKSKGIETLDPDLNELVIFLFKLGFKNDKIFRKLLCVSISTLCHGKLSICFKLLKNIMSSGIDNNTFDFLANMLQAIIVDESEGLDSKNLKDLFLNKVIIFLKDMYLNNKDNYFIKSKINELAMSLKFTLNDDITVSNKTIDFKAISMSLKLNSKIPFYYTFVKNKLTYLLEDADIIVINFDLTNIIDTNEELTTYLLKTYPSRIISNTHLNSIMSDLSQITSLNVNISSKLIEFLSTSEIDLDNVDGLINNILSIFEARPNTTKLTDKLLKLLGKIFKIEDETLIVRVIQLIDTFCQANEQKIRYSSICCLEKIITVLDTDYMNKYLFYILKVLIISLCDEHPEIRNISSKLTINMFSKHFPNTIKLHSNVVFTSEYIIHQLLSIKMQNQYPLMIEIRKFYDYLLKTNLYYPDNINLTNENKVFYYEPDNRFIDNIEMKLTIVQNKLNFPSSFETVLTVEPLKMQIMLETFVQHITANYKKLESLLVNDGDDKKLGIMNKLRKYIYKY